MVAVSLQHTQNCHKYIPKKTNPKQQQQSLYQTKYI